MRFRYTLNNAIAGSSTLVNDPADWDKITQSLVRNTDFHGVFTEFTTPLRFHCAGGGKQYIDAIYEAQGIEAIITINIEIACDDITFEGFFANDALGKLNLKTINQTRDFTEVNIVKDDLTTTLLNRVDVKVDLSSSTAIDGGTLTDYSFLNYDVVYHALPINFQSELEELTLPVTHTDTNSIAQGVQRNLFIQHPYPLQVNELKETTSNAKTWEAVNGGFDISTLLEPFHTEANVGISYPVTYTLTYDFSGDYFDIASSSVNRQTNGNSTLSVAYGANLATASSVGLGTVAGAYNTSLTTFTVSFNLTGSTDIVLNQGDSLWLFELVNGHLINGGPGPFNIENKIEYDTANLVLSTASIRSGTAHNSNAIFEAWSRTLESVTGQVAGVFESAFYGRKNSSPFSYADNGDGSFLAITNGFNLRGFPDRGIFTSIKDLFDCCNMLHNIGLGIEDDSGTFKVRVEEKDFFYDSATTIFTATDIAGLIMKVDPTRFFNEILIGFIKWNLEELNGLDEFCTKHEYTNYLTTVKSKLSLINPYIASGYMIEITRRKPFVDEGTTDTDEDENNFIVALNTSVDGGGVPDQLDDIERDENMTSTTGVTDPDRAYNQRLAVKNCLLRWNNVLAASLEKTSSEDWKFIKGEGNFTLTTEFDGTGINPAGTNGDYTGAVLDHDASLVWDDSNIRLDAPLWIPEVWSFVYKMTHTQFKTLRASPFGVVVYNRLDEATKKGYILDLEYSPVQGQAKFTLLRAPD